MTDDVVVIDVSDIGERAIKTAIEVFVVGLPASLVLNDVPALLDVAGAAGLAAAAAAAAVVLNAALRYARARKTRVQL